MDGKRHLTIVAASLCWQGTSKAGSTCTFLLSAQPNGSSRRVHMQLPSPYLTCTALHAAAIPAAAASSSPSAAATSASAPLIPPIPSQLSLQAQCLPHQQGPYPCCNTYSGQTALNSGDSFGACRPQSYKAYGSSKEDEPLCEVAGFESDRMELLRHVSFVDCPGESSHAFVCAIPCLCFSLF